MLKVHRLGTHNGLYGRHARIMVGHTRLVASGMYPPVRLGEGSWNGGGNADGRSPEPSRTVHGEVKRPSGVPAFSPVVVVNSAANVVQRTTDA